MDSTHSGGSGSNHVDASLSGGGGGGGAQAAAAAKKTAKLTQIDKQADSGRRLVEYFVVVSSIEEKPDDDKNKQQQKKKEDNNGEFNDWRTECSRHDGDDEDAYAHYMFKPTVTARYPGYDHHDNPLDNNVTFFCYPAGCIRLHKEEYMPKVHYFVSTGGTGKQIYGTCLTLWEPYKLEVRSRDLNKKEEEEQRAQQAPKMSVQERSRMEFQHQWQERIRLEAATQQAIQAIDQQPKEKVYEDVYVPKCLVILSTYPYLIAFREYLTQLHRLSRLGTMTLPIERYIVNFCSEIPAPPPGSFEVQTTILDSIIKIWCMPYNLPTAWVSLPFGILFECLDIDNIITVWHCLILERQVLITSTQVSVLTTASEIFLSLLFPMRWSHAYIPVLPTFLIPILSAPMPFLCGINKANLADALYDLSSDCVLVDLDKNTVTLGPETPALPPLPPNQANSLRNSLDHNVGYIFREARSLTRNDDYSDSGSNLPIHIKLMADAMWESKLCLYDEAFHLFFTPEETRKNHLNGNDASGLEYSERDLSGILGLSTTSDPTVGGSGSGHSRSNNDHNANSKRQSSWDAVQEAFVDTFVYLLRNYRKYLVFPSKHNEGSYGGAGFRSKEFIDGQRYDMRAILEQLVGTQMFDNFITKRLYGSGEADVSFFDLAVDKFLKNAGYFADVDISGRISSGFKSSASSGIAGGSMHGGGVGSMGSGGLSSTSKSRRTNPSRGVSSTQSGSATASSSSSSTNKSDPLVQSAKVHRKLKTIVPPEPTAEGLPDDVHKILDEEHGIAVINPAIAGSTASALSTANNVIIDDLPDDASVQSNSTAGSARRIGPSSSSVASSSLSTAKGGAGTTTASTAGGGAGTATASTTTTTTTTTAGKKKPTLTYRYDIFPSALNVDLFGTPRPLSAAVIAEFDRQRKDAAKFRRTTKKTKGGVGGKNQQYQKNVKNSDGSTKLKRSGGGGADNDFKPSPEVATFTVFFMAFSAIVGKELVDMANDPTFRDRADNQTMPQRSTSTSTTATIISDDDNNIDDDGDNESATSGTTGADNDDVEAMKASRPMSVLGGGDGATTTNGGTGPPDDNSTAGGSISKSSSTNNKKHSAGSSSRRQQQQQQQQAGGVGDDFGDDGKPKDRFANKLSDLQIEEAKATGRGQLGLAFEMLTMMKKRGLKADPEAYQCLIDACGRVGDTKRATELLGKMHEDGIVADGTVYACLVSAFSADSAWKDGTKEEDLPEWANSTAVEMDWNKLQKKSFIDTLLDHVVDPTDDDDDDDFNENATAYQKLRRRLKAKREGNKTKSGGSGTGTGGGSNGNSSGKGGSASSGGGGTGGNSSSGGGGSNSGGGIGSGEENRMEFFVTEAVERQIELGENLLEIVFPDISVDTENEVCPRCNFVLTDDDVVAGWTSGDSNNYTTTCPNCTQRFVPHFCVQCSSATFLGSRGVGSALMCERLSPWVLQKEIRSVMSEDDGMDNLLSPTWREREQKNAVLWWNLVLSCMRYRFPFSFLLQGSFEQQLIAPLPEDET